MVRCGSPLLLISAVGAQDPVPYNPEADPPAAMDVAQPPEGQQQGGHGEDAASLGHGVDGIDHEIDEGHLQLVRNTQHPRKVRGEVRIALGQQRLVVERAQPLPARPLGIVDVDLVSVDQITYSEFITEVQQGIGALLASSGNSEGEIRRVLQEQYEAGELRKETFQLVKSMLDRYVTEQAPTSPGMPDARGRIEPSLGANPAPAPHPKPKAPPPAPADPMSSTVVLPGDTQIPRSAGDDRIINGHEEHVFLGASGRRGRCGARRRLQLRFQRGRGRWACRCHA